ncbi:hypothetical protein SOP86_29025, partial [Pseudomonas canadensis]
MNYDFFMGQLRVLAIAGIAYAGGKGWLSSGDSATLTNILPVIGALAGPWLWSIYRNLNMKLVPKDSVAIAKGAIDNPETAKESGVAIINGTSAKVVGALLLAVILSPWLMTDAHAQAPSSACSLAIFKSIGPANFIKQLQTCGVDDAKAALDDATADKDQEALACLIPLNDLVIA